MAALHLPSIGFFHGRKRVKKKRENFLACFFQDSVIDRGLTGGGRGG